MNIFKIIFEILGVAWMVNSSRNQIMLTNGNL